MEYERIELAATKRFLAQLGKMQDPVKKAMNHFIEEFPNNIRLNTWDLKQYTGIKDKEFHFARISIGYRVVLYPPFKGDNTWYLIWVSRKPEVYGWVKNKKIIWNDKVHAMQEYGVSLIKKEKKQEDGQKPKIKGFMGTTREQLCEIGVPDEILEEVFNFHDRKDLSKIQQEIPNDVYENLSLLVQGQPIEKLIENVEAGKATEKGFEKEKQSANNRYYSIDLSTQNGSGLDDLAAWRIFLHPSQRKLVEGDFKGSVRVTGGAGTGKTVAALHRVVHLSSKGSGQVFFTTYTKALKAQLEKDIRSLGAHMAKVRVTFLDEEVAILARNFDIMPRSQAVIDFDPWGKQKETLEGIIQKWGYEDTIKPEDLHREYVDVILQYDCQTKEDYLEASRRGRGFRLGKKQRKAIWDMCEVYQEKQLKSGYKHPSYIFNEVARYLRAHPEKMPYKHVVADELQDFDLPRLRVLRALAPEGENDLFLVGDPFQKIFDVETNFKKAGIHVKGRRGKRLRINYRTTEEIRKYAIQPLEKLEKMNIYFRNFNGKVDRDQRFLSIKKGVVPTYEMFKTREEELSNLLESLQMFTDPEGEYKIMPEEIVVAAFRRTEGSEIYNYLYSQEFPCYLYQSGANRGDVNGVRISTLHSLKGLEYKVVILTGISEQNYQNWRVDDIFREGAQPMIRSKGALLYVACTRAILYLELSGVGKKVAFLQNQ